jgi:hypothetical protein
MKNIIISVTLIISASVAWSQFPNVVISAKYFPEEPSVCFSPKSPNMLVVGANLKNIYYSADYGLTWHSDTLESTLGVAGDPCIIADSNGNFYYFHLSKPQAGSLLDRIVCQKSTDNGYSWSDGSYTGLNSPKHQDKIWAAVDLKTNNLYAFWTQFDKYGSTTKTDSTNILFSRSADAGLTWSQAIRINKVAGNCSDSDSTVEGAFPAIGPEGEIYVSWAGPAGLIFTKSIDGGLTWPEQNVKAASILPGWDFNIPGIDRCNGMPVTCCDISNSPYHGTIYINWSDQRNDTTDTDIFLIKSTDYGQTWSEPKRVNDDPPGRHQFLSSMTIDQSTGFLYFVFYDRRNYTDLNTDVYLAVSRDGGETFRNFKISEDPFIPNPSIFFGDYTSIAAFNNRVRPMWMNMTNMVLSLVVAVIDSAGHLQTPELEPAITASLDQNYPNPASDFTFMSFKLNRPAEVTLTLHDYTGKIVVRLMDAKKLPAGKYVEGFDLLHMAINPGIYFYRLETQDFSVSKKMVIR